MSARYAWERQQNVLLKAFANSISNSINIKADVSLFSQIGFSRRTIHTAWSYIC